MDIKIHGKVLNSKLDIPIVNLQFKEDVRDLRGSYIDACNDLLLDMGRHGLISFQLHRVLGSALGHASQI